jgi:predicted porin
MKKTLVALAVLATAGSAQAIELFNQDKVTVSMSGDVEVYYVKGKTSGSEFKQEIGDADFGFDTRYAVNDDLQVGAYWEFDGADDGKTRSSAAVGDVYMGLYSATYGSLKFGKLNTQLDDIGTGNDYNFGVNKFVDNADVGGHEAVRYDIDKGNFYGGFGIIQSKGSANKDAFGDDGGLFDAKLGARFADFDATFFYGQASQKEGAKVSILEDADNPLRANEEFETKLMGLELDYTGVENLTLELGYYTTDIKVKASDRFEGSTDNKTFAAAASYDFQVVVVNAGLSNTKYSDARNEDTAGEYDSHTDWFLNVAYPFAPGVEAYAEVGGDNAYSLVDAEYKKNGTGFAVGLSAEF